MAQSCLEQKPPDLIPISQECDKWVKWVTGLAQGRHRLGLGTQWLLLLLVQSAPVWGAAPQKPPDHLPHFMPSLTGGSTSHILKQNTISPQVGLFCLCVPGLGCLGNTALVASCLLGEKSRFLGCCPQPTGFMQREGILFSSLACFLAPNILKANFSITWLCHMHSFIQKTC